MGFSQQFTFQVHGNDSAYILDASRALTYYPYLSESSQPYEVRPDVSSFVATSAATVYYTDDSGTLWEYTDNWATPSASAHPVQIDGHVAAFLPTGPNLLVLSHSDHKLWLEYPPFGREVPPKRMLIDENVAAFSDLFITDEAGFRKSPPGTLTQIFVRRTDLTLWLEGWFQPQNTDHTQRMASVQVDGNVAGFQAFDTSNVAVLGFDRNLWLETGPWGQIPPSRQQIDANVNTFVSTGGPNEFAIIGSDNKLWFATAPWGQVPPQRTLIDANVQAAFPNRQLAQYFVLGLDGKLWYEYGNFGSLPPKRVPVGVGANGGGVICTEVSQEIVAPRRMFF